MKKKKKFSLKYPPEVSQSKAIKNASKMGRKEESKLERRGRRILYSAILLGLLL